MNPLLLALQHADSTFPSGGFAFSQGLEGWTAGQGRPGAAELRAFISQQLRRRWASADRLALIRAHAAADLDAVLDVDRDFDRTQVVGILADGSRRNGRALLASHQRLATPGAAAFARRAATDETPAHLPVVQGCMWRALGMDADSAAQVAGYAFVAGQLTAAVRLNLIGAIASQRLLADLLPEIAEAAARPVRAGDDFASFTPFAEIAAMRGATGESRLFSN